VTVYQVLGHDASLRFALQPQMPHPSPPLTGRVKVGDLEGQGAQLIPLLSLAHAVDLGQLARADLGLGIGSGLSHGRGSRGSRSNGSGSGCGGSGLDGRGGNSGIGGGSVAGGVGCGALLQQLPGDGGQGQRGGILPVNPAAAGLAQARALVVVGSLAAEPALHQAAGAGDGLDQARLDVGGGHHARRVLSGGALRHKNGRWD